MVTNALEITGGIHRLLAEFEEGNKMKINIKQFLPKSVRDFLWQRKRDLLFLGYLARRLVHRIRFRTQYAEMTHSLRQHILTYDSAVELGSVKDLPAIFKRLGFEFNQGRHTIYLYRESDIRSINPEIVELYPHPFGLKIIKSSNMSPDGTPYYTSSKIAPASSPITMQAVGSVKEKMVLSNILSLRNVAPRVYDIVRLRSGDTVVFAMVMQHIEGQIITGQTASEFVEQFKCVLREEKISILGEKDHIDFRPPDFQSNIVSDSTGTYYVDIQNFAIIDEEARRKKLADAIQEVTHFGNSRLFRPQKYAYQSMPGLPVQGKRDSLYRISRIQSFLEQNQVSFQGSTVLDVGCNLGIFLMHSLSQGAHWCVGLDTPEMAQVTRQFLFEQGFSRFDLIGCDLCDPVVADLLPFKKYDLILYLSIEKHVGFPDWLNELDFRLFLYEGHAREGVKDITIKVRQWSPQIEIVEHQVLQDGDSEPRPVLLCRIQES